MEEEEEEERSEPLEGSVCVWHCGGGGGRTYTLMGRLTAVVGSSDGAWGGDDLAQKGEPTLSSRYLAWTGAGGPPFPSLEIPLSGGVAQVSAPVYRLARLLLHAVTWESLSR